MHAISQQLTFFSKQEQAHAQYEEVTQHIFDYLDRLNYLSAP
jgi:hypothetical protein